MARYNELVVAATHNSYSGGDRGSLTHQLDRGVRFVELDVHDNDFVQAGYRLGHDEPGDAVEHSGGNPPGNGLGEWLQAVADWSARQRAHVPIVVALDLKDSLTDNRSYRDGNPAALNDLLAARLPRLLAAEELGGGTWPTVEDLRKRVIVVLSGDGGTRQAYVRDPGHNPAVAVNAAGRVVEVHDSGGGDLWYWTGEFVSPGEVRWQRHARYDSGRLPAVAMNDAGRIVEVHVAPSGDRLWYRVGQLTADFELTWTQAGGRGFPHDDQGRGPTVRFLAAERVREVHMSESNNAHWYWNGSLGADAVAWTRADSGNTNDPLFSKSVGSAGARSLSVVAAANGAFGGDTLLYRAGGAPLRRIRYRQLAFVEVQPGDDVLARDGPWFFAGPADDPGARAWAAGWRRGGKLVRLWQVTSAAQGIQPPASFPATDHPDASWYREYCASVGARS